MSSTGVDAVPLRASVSAPMHNKDHKPMKAGIGSEHTCPAQYHLDILRSALDFLLAERGNPLRTKPICLTFYVFPGFPLVHMWDEVLPFSSLGMKYATSARSIAVSLLPTSGFAVLYWMHPTRSPPAPDCLLLPKRLPLN